MARLTKILFISHDPQMFGAQKSLLDLMTGLDRERYSPYLLSSKEGPLTELAAKESIEVLIRPFYWWIGGNVVAIAAKTILNRLNYPRIAREVKRIAPDLIYTNTAVIPVGGHLSQKLGIPHVWHVREFVKEDLGVDFDLGERASMAFMAERSEKIVCNSLAILRKFARHIPEEKLALVYNGILEADEPPPEPPRSPSDEPPFTLCIVGHVAAYKGQSDAVRAVKRLKDMGIETKLRIVGSGAESEVAKLRELIEQSGLTDEVSLEGYSDDVRSVFQSCDLALVCSRREAFGRVAVEAMAAGTPVVGTDSGGLPEIIHEGKTGFLYPPGDVEKLAEKIRTLFGDAELYRSISEEGRRSVYERFNKKRYITDIERIIRETVRP